MASKELEALKEKFGTKILSCEETRPTRAYVEVDPEDILEVCVYVFDDLHGRFITASGVDMLTYLYAWPRAWPSSLPGARGPSFRVLLRNVRSENINA